jgi:hypothetical protein
VINVEVLEQGMDVVHDRLDTWRHAFDDLREDLVK